MKKLITICLLLATTFIVDAQVNFKDKNLALLEKIAFTTSYNSIKSFMKDNYFTLINEEEIEMDLPNNQLLETLFFNFKDDSTKNEVLIWYFKKNKQLLNTIYTFAQKDVKISELELKNKLFKLGIELEEAKIWYKDTYKYQIFSLKEDEETTKLGFISPSSPEFILDFAKKSRDMIAEEDRKTRELKRIENLFEKNLIGTSFSNGRLFGSSNITKIRILDTGEIELKTSNAEFNETFSIIEFEIIEYKTNVKVLNTSNNNFGKIFWFNPNNVSKFVETLKELKEM